MPDWIQWLNDNWHHIVIPIAILIGFIVGGKWIRRLAYERISNWAKRTNQRGLALFIFKLYSPILFWFVLLGIYVATATSVLPPETTQTISTILLSLFVSSLIWIAFSLSGSITNLYLPRARQYLTRARAPQPPTGLVVNALRTVFIVLGTALLFRIWGLPNVIGLLVLIAAATIGILAIREAVGGMSRRFHPSYNTQKRLHSAGKVFLSLLIVAGIVDAIRRIYLIAVMGIGTTLDVVLLFIEIGFVIWFINIIRSPNYRKAKPSFKLVTTLLVSIVLILAFAGVHPLASYKDSTIQYLEAQTARVNEFIEARSSEGDITKVVEEVSPSIVRLESSEYIGTGMIVDERGYALTCDHVLDGSQSAYVTLYSGAQFQATVVSRDPYKDLALVKINATGYSFPAITLSDSDRLKTGQEIIVIGYSLGLEGETTVSRGIISALRTIEGVDYVQTDAAVNPGNSGGPILDLNGDVVGIVTSKIVAEGVEGMSFSVAINSTKPFISQTIAMMDQQDSTKSVEQTLLELEQETFSLINLERQNLGIPPVQWNDAIHSAARTHSRDMQTKGSLYHDKGGNYAECCYGADYASSVYATARGAVDAWMSSPGHRQILLDPSYVIGAVGIAKDEGFWATYRCK